MYFLCDVYTENYLFQIIETSHILSKLNIGVSTYRITDISISELKIQIFTNRI